MEKKNKNNLRFRQYQIRSACSVLLSLLVNSPARPHVRRTRSPTLQGSNPNMPPPLIRRATFFIAASFLLLLLPRFPSPFSCPSTVTSSSARSSSSSSSSITTVHHLLFGVASSARSWPRRKSYLRHWWRPGLTRGAVYLDSPLPSHSFAAGDTDDDFDFPPIRVSADTSRIPYTFKGGLRSAVRVARIVKELVDEVVANGSASHGDVRWVVLGDDDTLFVPGNLVSVLANYDWEQWYYVGAPSESLGQNIKYSFWMAFGGGGYAISFPLARVLAKYLDSCLVRYAHLYGSDAKIFSCLAELGVVLTREPGFHQIDLRGDIFGLLSAHPLAPLVSLHHLDYAQPLFPGMNHTEALEKFFKAVDIDPGRTLHQSICYDRLNLRTVSVSWGYVIQVFEGNQLLPDLLSAPLTFTPWKRSRGVSSSFYTFDTRQLVKDPCERPAVFFLETVSLQNDSTKSNYARHAFKNCSENGPTKDLKHITVFSRRLYFQPRQAVRRECCDVLNSSSEMEMEIAIRKCKNDELIAMQL